MMLKVGDRVKLVKVGGSVPNSFGYKIGDVASVLTLSDEMSIVIKMDYGPEEKRTLFVCSHEIESSTPYTPPATIQHEGYNYTRGEPVVPEWVKDGAWVIHKDTGKIGKVSKAHTAYFNPLDKTFRVNFSNHLVADDFRPFTAADWKWGMWAEYKGEKVFVCGNGFAGIYASKPTEEYCFIPFSDITPTTAP